MSALFNFEVHTPYRLFFSGKAEAVILTLVDGEIGIYANHSPVTAPVVTCILRIKDADGNWKTAFISGGILEVKDVKNILLVESAEWPEEIDRELAIASKKEAEEVLSSSQFRFEKDDARAKLKRAECRLRVLSASLK